MKTKTAKSNEQLRAELHILDEQITERKRYLKEQERIITETVENGNTKLMMLTHEVSLLETQKRQLSGKIRAGRRELLDIRTSLQTARSELATLPPTASITAPIFHPLVAQ